MARTEKSNKYRKVSFWNWLGTLILFSIPGVNVIALILTAVCGVLMLSGCSTVIVTSSGQRRRNSVSPAV